MGNTSNNSSTYSDIGSTASVRSAGSVPASENTQDEFDPENIENLRPDEDINNRTKVNFSSFKALILPNTVNIVTNNVINTSAFISTGVLNQSGKTYAYNTINLADGVNDEVELAQYLTNLAVSRGIGFFQFENVNAIPSNINAGGPAGFTNQPVKMFCHTSIMDDPTFQEDAESTSTYQRTLSPFRYSPMEKQALKDKFGYEHELIDDSAVDVFTQTKLDDFTSQISSDLRSGILARIDIVKTTKKLELTPEIFEKVTADEILETSIEITGVESENIQSTLPATQQSAATSTTTTAATTSTSTGGSY